MRCSRAAPATMSASHSRGSAGPAVWSTRSFAAQPPPLPEPCHELEVAPVLARFAGFEDRLVDVPMVELDEQSFQALGVSWLAAPKRRGMLLLTALRGGVDCSSR